MLLAAAVTGGCHSARQAGSASAANPTYKTYKLRGKVVSTNASTSQVTLNHEAIPGYMEAMTMQFPIKDAAEFGALQIGNCIEGTVFVQPNSIWVGDIKHLNATADECVPRPTSAK